MFDVAMIRVTPPDQFHGLIEKIHSSRGVVTGDAILNRKGNIETFPNSAVLDRLLRAGKCLRKSIEGSSGHRVVTFLRVVAQVLYDNIDYLTDCDTVWNAQVFGNLHNVRNSRHVPNAI
jgi:hypothetical protein